MDNETELRLHAAQLSMALVAGQGLDAERFVATAQLIEAYLRGAGATPVQSLIQPS